MDITKLIDTAGMWWLNTARWKAFLVSTCMWGLFAILCSAGLTLLFSDDASDPFGMVKETPIFALFLTCAAAYAIDLVRESGRNRAIQQRTQHRKESEYKERLIALEERVTELEQQLNDRDT
jgi:hypothetical protein